MLGMAIRPSQAQLFFETDLMPISCMALKLAACRPQAGKKRLRQQLIRT